MDQYFSSATKELLAKAEEVSMDLHYIDVNTYTMFLAQCLLDHDALTIGSLVFRDEPDFQRYYSAQRMIMQYHFPDYTPGKPLPFTNEFNEVISGAGEEMRSFGHTSIEPGHLFLAATRDPATLLNRMVSPAAQLHEQAIDFYSKTAFILGRQEIVKEPVKPKGWFSRLLNQTPHIPERPAFLPLTIKMTTGISEAPVSRYDAGTDFEKTEVETAAISVPKEQPGNYAIVVKDKESDKVVPFLVGVYEAEQLAIALEGMEEWKPQVMGVLNEILNRLGYTVKESVVYGRVSGVFFTRIILTSANGSLAIESRPSDALTLAVLSGTPFYFAKMIFDKVSIDPGQADADNKNETQSE